MRYNVSVFGNTNGGEIVVNVILFKQKLVELGISRAKLAELSGVSLSSINYMLNYNSSPTADTIVKLCRAMQIDDDAEKARIFLN